MRDLLKTRLNNVLKPLTLLSSEERSFNILYSELVSLAYTPAGQSIGLIEVIDTDAITEETKRMNTIQDLKESIMKGDQNL
jgi:hypothetical protein